MNNHVQTIRFNLIVEGEKVTLIVKAVFSMNHHIGYNVFIDGGLLPDGQDVVFKTSLSGALECAHDVMNLVLQGEIDL